jgi:hypothetical protein
MAFIQTITHAGRGSKEKWQGDRDMIDMMDIYKKYIYLPETKGSNSIKYVLPATIAHSPWLQNRYAQPVYGTDIPSLNYNPLSWVQIKDGNLQDPYSLLPSIDDSGESTVFRTNALADGGAALQAYGVLQFANAEHKEREALKMALFRYCELDTFAMIMLMEAWLYDFLKK